MRLRELRERFVWIMLGGLFMFALQFLPNVVESKILAQGNEKQASSTKVLPADFDVVTCRGLKVVDEKGKVRMIIDPGENGGAIKIFDLSGKVRAHLEAQPTGLSIIIFYGPDGKNKWPINLP